MSRGKSCFSIGSQSYYSARSAHLLCRPYKNVEGRKSSHNNFKPIDRRSFLRYHNHNISDLLIGFPAFLPYLRKDSNFYRRYGRLFLFSLLLTVRRSGKAGYLWEYKMTYCWIILTITADSQTFSTVSCFGEGRRSARRSWRRLPNAIRRGKEEAERGKKERSNTGACSGT